MGNAHPFRSGTLLLGVGLIWLGLGLSMLVMQIWQQRAAWSFGQDRGGDMKQHYAVALMLKENGGDYRPLYHDFVFSREITRIFNEDLYKQGLYLDRHNYRYSPVIAWISWKLVDLPYGLWLRVWEALSFILAISSLLFLRNAERETGTQPLLFLELVFFLGFPPLLYGFSINQNAPLTLFISAVAAWLLKNRRDWLAGLVFGSICYKPQLMPYIAVVMLLFGQWRFAIATGLATAFWLGLGILICGWKAHWEWIQSLMEIIHGVQGDEMGTNMPWKGFVLTVFPEGQQTIALLLANLLGILILAALVYFVHRAKKHPDWKTHHSFYLALLWWLLFTPHVKAYELVLALPLMLLLFRIRGVSKTLVISALALFYFSGFAVVACRFLGFSPGAPLVTIALILAVMALKEPRSGWAISGGSK